MIRALFGLRYRKSRKKCNGANGVVEGKQKGRLSCQRKRELRVPKTSLSSNERRESDRKDGNGADDSKSWVAPAVGIVGAVMGAAAASEEVKKDETREERRERRRRERELEDELERWQPDHRVSEHENHSPNTQSRQAKVEDIANGN